MNSFGTPDRQWLRLWAKWDRKSFLYHPLLYHMLDVAAVATLAWESCLAPQLKKRIERSFGTDSRTHVVFLAGSHDIGKASPGFQKKVPELAKDFGLPFSVNDLARPHGIISAHVLKEAVDGDRIPTILAQITGGHHGIFPRSSELRMGRDTLGNHSWSAVRQELLQELARVVRFDVNRGIAAINEIEDPAVVPILAGFISVVDWIGSNQDFFPCTYEPGASADIRAEDYWVTAQDRARKALEKLGWLPAVTFANEAPFDSVFKGFVPNHLQETAIELASKQSSPYLMIVEAPMGKGKTEAALYAADLAMCRGFARGIYVAMPTQATGNAMFKRLLDDYLKTRGHGGKLNVQLVHGDAILAQMEHVQEGEISEFSPRSIGNNDDLEAQSWFTAKKRPLLAPFGVGTIDQSLLSVLQTKHWFVRLFGLTGKVVIFDEVHAYDAYMGTIIERLLHWLAETGCTVILLSATLPESKRKALTKAYSGREDAGYKRYPRITLARARRYPNERSDLKPVCEAVAKGEASTIHLELAETDLDSLSETLSKRMEPGGCTAVICNTVNRAIEVYKHLRDNLTDTECSLFHARTLRMWRREREQEVLRKFGKGEQQIDGTYVNSHRPKRAVLVATQVIEQSLDLDFDLMVSEIAPVDLLLQRSGRLHRHRRERPMGLEKAQFIILCDADRDGPPPESFGKSIEFVYDRYILLRTWLTLRQRQQVEMPSEIETLVEAVYGESVMAYADDWDDALVEAKRKMEDSFIESEKNASRLLVSPPRDPSDLIEEFNERLVDDDDPQVHKTVKAATREGDPSITVVMMRENEVHESEPEISDIRTLLDRSAKMSHRGIYQSLLNDGESPPQWKNNAHLRHARLLRLDEMSQSHVGDYILTVDEKLGVVIERTNNG